MKMSVSLQAERGLPGNMAVPKLRAMVEDFKSTLPVVINLRNAALKNRHWDEIHAALGFEVHGVDGFTLGELIDNRAMDAADAIGRVTTEAMQESVKHSSNFCDLFCGPRGRGHAKPRGRGVSLLDHWQPMSSPR